MHRHRRLGAAFFRCGRAPAGGAVILSSTAYLAVRFPTDAPLLVSVDLHAALKALNITAHAAMRSARGNECYADLITLTRLTDNLVDRATIAPVTAFNPPEE